MNESEQLYGPLWWQRVKIVGIGVAGICILTPLVLMAAPVAVVAWTIFRLRNTQELIA